MKDFLLNNYSLLLYLTESMAAITGLLLYKKYKRSNAKYFIWFLVYLFIGDFIGGYKNYVNDGFLSFLKGTVFATNHWWSTLFWKVGAILFFSFYFSKILKTSTFKFIVKISGVLFLFFCVIYIGLHWDDFFHRFFPIISILGTIVIFLCTGFYFIETLLSDRILTFYKSLNFYISMAIFIWWLIITPLVFYDLYHSSGDWNFIFLKWEIYLFANIFMYSTFTFALIFCKPEEDVLI